MFFRKKAVIDLWLALFSHNYPSPNMGYSTEKIEKYAQEKNINPLTTVTPFFENTRGMIQTVQINDSAILLWKARLGRVQHTAPSTTKAL